MTEGLPPLQDGVDGCERCVQSEPQRAFEFWEQESEGVGFLVDSSHFQINIRRCPHCGQGCVRVFTEFMNFSGGADHAYWDFIPVTAAEVEWLLAEGAATPDASVQNIARGRRTLQVNWPARFEEPRIAWKTGDTYIMRGC